MYKYALLSGMMVTVFVVLFQASSTKSGELYFIDAHSQVDHKVIPLQKVVSLMKQGGVSHTILSARGKLKGKDLQRFAAQYPDQISLAIRSKGKPYNSGSPKYYKMLQDQVSSGKYIAMAELLLYHAKKGNKAGEYIIYPEDKRVISALNCAIEKNWPFVVHIEFAALNGKGQSFMVSLERMLVQNPSHPFVITHMGQLKVEECQRLIESYKNIHFHTGWSNPAAVNSSKQPWVNIFEGQHLAAEWRKLFVQYPERFIFALDNVFSEHWSSLYVEQMIYWKQALKDLPVEVAHLIAHGNAERLWHIAPNN